MRPSIGVTGPDRGGFPAWFFTSWALRAAGARPLRITPRRGPPPEPLDGLVVGGGADIEPARYAPHEPAPPLEPNLEGKERARALGGYLVAPVVYVLRRLFAVKDGPRVDPGRDALEMDLIHEALEGRMPILGICRGAQVLNVALGGTLYRDLASFYVEHPHRWTVFPRKEVHLEPHSHLARLLGKARVRVNSLHRQAVDRLGRGMTVTAREQTGVVQGIELDDHPFAVGVQWHPEYLPQRPEQRGLFDGLVRAALAYRDSRATSRLGAAEQRTT